MHLPKRLLVLVLCVVIALVGWFVLSTRMSKSTKMALYMPAEDGAMNTNTLHLVMVKDAIIYYIGDLTPSTATQKTSMAGVKDVILQYKQKSKENCLSVIITSTTEATYKNTVDVLDEMTTNEVKRYALMDLTENEKKLLQL